MQYLSLTRYGNYYFTVIVFTSSGPAQVCSYQHVKEGRRANESVQFFSLDYWSF